MVQLWFIYGLTMIDSEAPNPTMVQLWFIYGLSMVQLWFNYVFFQYLWFNYDRF